jgi:hypothetical protein
MKFTLDTYDYNVILDALDLMDSVISSSTILDPNDQPELLNQIMKTYETVEQMKKANDYEM